MTSDAPDCALAEIGFADALAMIDRGEIVDGKTIMLLLYAQWKQLASPATGGS